MTKPFFYKPEDVPPEVILEAKMKMAEDEYDFWFGTKRYIVGYALVDLTNAREEIDYPEPNDFLIIENQQYLMIGWNVSGFFFRQHWNQFIEVWVSENHVGRIIDGEK